MRTERVRWSEQVERGLAECLKPAGGPGTIPDQVEAGLIDLWRIDAGRCYLATESRGETLFVHAIEGRNAQDVITAVVEGARAQGYKAVRFHTHRKGMGRLLARWGFVYEGPSEGLAGFCREF